MPLEEMPGFVRVVHDWTGKERWNAILCRLGRTGPRTRVPPGLYALGAPAEGSPAVVTASCRLTFDLLRRDLSGISCWILVLDTHGLDVASAAAAGRFGTDELVAGLAASRLARLVSHNSIIVPGRAAATVDPGQVAAGSAFQVLAGPARSSDLPAFLAGGTARADHRLGPSDAAALAPAELGRSLLSYPGFAFAALLFAGLGPGGVNVGRALAGSWPLLVLGLASVLAGSLLAPILHAGIRRIPLWAAGAVTGLGAAAALMAGARFSSGMDPFLQAGCWLFFPAASAFLAVRFLRAMPAESARAAAPVARLPSMIATAVAALSLIAFTLSKIAQWGRVP